MTVTTRTTKNNIIFSIKLPLVNENEFQLFQILPLPVSNSSSTIFIQPSTELLMVDLKREHYYPLSSFELSQCHKSMGGGFQCKQKQLLHKTNADNKQCEISILQHRRDISTICDIQVGDPVDSWVQLSTLNRWLFSIHRRVTVDIICNNVPYGVDLYGQGIISFHDRCQLQLPGIQLTSFMSFNSTKKMSYLPNLNISTYAEKMTRQSINSNATTAFHNGTNEINRLRSTITDLQNSKVPYIESWHNAHHYSVTYLIIAALAGMVVIWFRYKQDIAQAHAKIMESINNQLVQVRFGSRRSLPLA